MTDTELVRLGPVAGPRIRVVLFGGGPGLEPGLKDFLCRLEEHPDIEFLAAFCQSPGRSLTDIVRDVWRRRRWLAAPVLAVQLAGLIRRNAAAPRRERQFRKKISRLSSRIHFVPDIHAAEVLDRIKELSPDLGLVYGSPILKPELFQIPSHGTLGIHHGKMPQYRGKKTTFWEMASGEETAGVTIQRIGKGLDTGSIVKQGVVPIHSRSYRRVWEAVEALGVELYIAAILETKRGEAVCRPSQGEKGKLYRDPKLADLARFYLKRLRGLV